MWLNPNCVTYTLLHSTSVLQRNYSHMLPPQIILLKVMKKFIPISLYNQVGYFLHAAVKQWGSQFHPTFLTTITAHYILNIQQLRWAIQLLTYPTYTIPNYTIFLPKPATHNSCHILNPPFAATWLFTYSWWWYVSMHYSVPFSYAMSQVSTVESTFHEK